MKQINLFIELTRLKKPIGFMLLFWPCLWGLTIACDFSQNINTYFFYVFLFLSGSILMRSAGCIVNDIMDKNFDKKVKRTKNRPIASGKISIKLGFIYAIILCFLAFLILINFNKFTILLAIASMPLAFSYPLMKRFTYWPQIYLGITFNYGVILGWVSMNGQLDFNIFVLYIGAIFWTLGYDTIYGFQDMKDDEIIGVKSASIKFKNNPKKFIFASYLIFIISIVVIGKLMDFNNFYFLLSILLVYHLIFMQVKKLNINSSENCLKIFRSNNLFGFLFFITIIIGKI